MRCTKHKTKGTEMGVKKNMLALTCCVCGDDTHERLGRRDGIQKMVTGWDAMRRII